MRTVSEARSEFFDRVINLKSDTVCPCCNRKANLYPVSIGYMNVRLLEEMCSGQTYKVADLPRIPTEKAPKGKFVTTYSVMPHFGLIDSQKRGEWARTRDGEAFLSSYVNIPAEILIFDERPFAVSHETLSIDDCRDGKRPGAVTWKRLDFELPELEDTEMPLCEATSQHQQDIRKASGTRCVVCGRFDKVYKRPLTPDMCRVLAIMARDHGVGTPVHVYNQIDACGGDYAKLRYWGLIDAQEENGAWALTPKGKSFVDGKITVQKQACIYHSEHIGFVGDFVTIKEAASSKFNLDTLLNT